MERQPHAPTTIADLEREVMTLERRLNDGEQRIEEARHIGADTGAWEEFWIELLHTYEVVYDRLQATIAEDSRLAA